MIVHARSSIFLDRVNSAMLGATVHRSPVLPRRVHCRTVVRKGTRRGSAELDGGNRCAKEEMMTMKKTPGGSNKGRAAGLLAATAGAAMVAALLTAPSESKAIPQGPNTTDFGSFCGSTPDDCFDFTLGTYGNPSNCTNATRYATPSYIASTSFADLCRGGNRWIAI